MINIEDFESDFAHYVESKEVDNLIFLFSDLKDHIVEGDVEATEFIVDPSNLTRFYKEMIEKLNAPRAFSRPRVKTSSHNRRARLNVTSIISGLELIEKYNSRNT